MLDVCLTVSAENHFRPSGGWLRVMRVIRVHGHILQFVQCAIVLLVMPWACTYLTGCSNLASHSPSLRAALIFIISYNTLYWKPTSIQMIENIPLTSLVDICILLKERASQETDFLQPSPATTRGFKSTLECDRHRERPREILTRRSRDVQVHKVHKQSANAQCAVLSRNMPLGDLQVILDLANQ